MDAETRARLQATLDSGQLTDTQRTAVSGMLADDTTDPARPRPDDNGDYDIRLVLAVEGLETSDRRVIQDGALSHRTLPLSIAGMTATSEGGHLGAVVCGRLDAVDRVPGPQVRSRKTREPFPEGTYVWRGTGKLFGPKGADPDHGSVLDLVLKGGLSGNSVDLNDTEVELTQDKPDEGAEHVENYRDNGDGTTTMTQPKPPLATFTRGVIGMTTLCPVPAFEEAYVELGTADGWETVTPAGTLADVEPTPFLAGDAATVPTTEDQGVVPPTLEALDDELFAATVDADTGEKHRRAYKKGLALPPLTADGKPRFPIENSADLDRAKQAIGRAKPGDAAKIKAHIRKAARKLKLDHGLADDPDAVITAAGTVQGEPLPLPPAWWFRRPTAEIEAYGTTPTDVPPMHVDHETGRLWGYVGSWRDCHTGYTDRCVVPPRSPSAYANFHVGVTRALDDHGQVVAVPTGPLTVGPGHATTTPGTPVRVATSHYDSVATCAGRIVCGEDEFGIWAAGTLVPGCDELLIRTIEGAPPSGDWRAEYQQPIDMIAVHSVNTPGYRRTRRPVAYSMEHGHLTALVAAGALDPAAGTPAPPHLDIDYDRLAQLVADRVNAGHQPTQLATNPATCTMCPKPATHTVLTKGDGAPQHACSTHLDAVKGKAGPGATAKELTAPSADLVARAEAARLQARRDTALGAASHTDDGPR